MKVKKFLGSIIVLGMCLMPLTTIYGQPEEQIEVNVEGEKTSILAEEVLKSFEGEAIFPYFVEMVASSGQEYITQGLAARIICDYFGVSPVVLDAKEGSKDTYIARLKVEGVWEGLSLDPDVMMTYEAWNKLISQSAKLKEQGGVSVNTKLQKPKVNFKEITLGKLVKSKNKLIYGEQAYGIYEVADTSFVRVKDLQKMGFAVNQKDSGLEIHLDESKISDASDNKNVEGSVKTNPQHVYIGNLKTYSIKSGEEVLIPIRALSHVMSVAINSDSIVLIDHPESSNNHVGIYQKDLVNMKDRPIDVMIRSLYWDGKEIKSVEQSFKGVQPGQALPIPDSYFALVNQECQYLTTLIDQVAYIDDMGMPVNHQYIRYDDYGQNNKSYYMSYTKSMQKPPQTEQQPESKELFPATIIIGTMKYDTKGLKKGAKVEVWAAEQGEYYTVISNGKKVNIPWNSISIPANSPVQKNQATKVQLEAYINQKGFTSKSNYLVWTDLHRQRTYVFKKQGGSWVLHKNMLCSTGNNKTPTPRGEFTLTSYVSAFGMNKGYMCKNAVGIFGDYLYHSVMFDKTGSYQLSGVGKLGNQASAGCIRLSYEDSVWFYKNMPLGTKVWIN